MRRLTVFENISLDGFFTDGHGDMSWAHASDPEWVAFTNENANGGGMLLFGRTTYEMMASFWPTPMAAKQMPVVAERMNAMPKVVFSRSLETAAWVNTTIVRDDIGAAVRKLKSEAGPDMAIMGSGTIVSQLASEALIDELLIAVHPIVLGSGRTLFEAVTSRIDLKLTRTRAFENGNVVLSYRPA